MGDFISVDRLETAAKCSHRASELTERLRIIEEAHRTEHEKLTSELADVRREYDQAMGVEVTDANQIPDLPTDPNPFTPPLKAGQEPKKRGRAKVPERTFKRVPRPEKPAKPSEAPPDGDDQDPRSKMVLELLSRRGQWAMSELVEHTGLSSGQVAAALRKLGSRGRVKVEGQLRWTRYSLR